MRLAVLWMPRSVFGSATRLVRQDSEAVEWDPRPGRATLSAVGEDPHIRRRRRAELLAFRLH